MEEGLASDMVKMSTGVVFRVKPPPMFALQALGRKLEQGKPKPPVMWIKEKERQQENPEDPDYKAALVEHERQTAEVMYDAVILLCTKVANVPADMVKAEDDSWVEELKILGIGPGQGKKERYLAWVKFYAAPSVDDFIALQRAIQRRVGVPEEDVNAAIAAFKSGQERRTDRAAQPPERG